MAIVTYLSTRGEGMCVEQSEPHSVVPFPGLFLLVSGMRLSFQYVMTNYMYRGALQPSLYPSYVVGGRHPVPSHDPGTRLRLSVVSSCSVIIATYCRGVSEGRLPRSLEI